MDAVRVPWRRRRKWATLVVATVACSFAGAVLPWGVAHGDGSGQGDPADDPVATVIARYQAGIPQLMTEQSIPGLAVALVDTDRVLWVEGFGHIDGPGSAPITADTIFSVQSMSKLFTATAVMQAVAAGHLDLDEPITTYLPEFTVRSAFEEHPERKITVRMLLGHTAGFTHEAPVGNNNELDAGDFDAHVASISDTWLRFPVGTGYAYSNLGIDLAGYILERVEGKEFHEIVRDSLLEPLGMERSTLDRAAIRASVDRAVGHAKPYPQPPLDVPMTAAGGLYTSAADLASFLRFQLNDGALDGQVVLDPRLMVEMRAVPAPREGATAGYALGVTRHRWNRWDQRPDLFDHGGGGFGFLSDVWWAPQLWVGVAVLTNSHDHQLQGDLALSILTDLVTTDGPYRDRLLALPSRPTAADPGRFEPPPDLPTLIDNAAMPPSGDDTERWSAWVGTYGAPAWGVIDPTAPAARFLLDGGVPYLETKEEGTFVRHRLVEVEPDVFLADNGETLDLSGGVLRGAGLRLVRLAGGPATWQWIALSAAAIIAGAWLVAALARTIRRRVRPAPGSQVQAGRHWHRIATAVASVTALLVLANVALVIWMPGLVDSGFIGWLELPLATRSTMHLPVALGVLAGGTVALTVVGWVGRWWSSTVTLQHAMLSIVATMLVVQLAGWHLLGVGLN